MNDHSQEGRGCMVVFYVTYALARAVRHSEPCQKLFIFFINFPFSDLVILYVICQLFC